MLFIADIFFDTFLSNIRNNHNVSKRPCRGIKSFHTYLGRVEYTTKYNQNLNGFSFKFEHTTKHNQNLIIVFRSSFGRTK